MNHDVVLDLPASPQKTVARLAYPRHLKLKAEANRDQAAPEEGPDATGPYAAFSGPSAQAPHWALGDAKPGMARMEGTFKGLLAEKTQT